MPASARLQRPNRGFWLTLIGSFAVHSAAFATIAVLQAMRPPAPQLQQAIPVELVKLGKPRDAKLLPRIARPAPPPPPPDRAVNLDTGKTKPNKPEKPAKPEKAKPQPQLSPAAERMLRRRSLDKAMSKLDSLPTETPDEGEGSPTGSVYGTTTDPARAASGYLAEVSAALTAAYRLPKTIPSDQRRFLSAQVMLHIEGDGRISSYEFIQRHPNQAFMSALERLLKQIKLPPPPKALAARFRRGQAVEFTP